MALSRRLKRFAVVAAIGGLLLNVAAPMLANAAAAMAGVPTGEICEVYGIRFPQPPSVGEHVHHAGMAMDDEAADDVAAREGGAHSTVDGHGASDHHHAPGLHAGGHCALTALATFALPAPGGVAPSPPASAIHRASLDGARRPAFDAVARWASSRKTGPPRAVA